MIKIEKKVIRTLTIKAFHIENVEISCKTKIEKGKLSISDTLITNKQFESELIESVKVKILTKKDRDCSINTIMDIVPISTKVLGRIGEGITHTLTGVYVMLTGADKSGKQMAEFGSSNGILSEQMVFGRAGTPGVEDIIIHIDVT
ncbi:MAG: proline reductase cluster protein PrdD, partial [Acidaminobacteraceae bacterium]